ncbi:hypothetical protein D3C75_724830 [compost metagenome]
MRKITSNDKYIMYGMNIAGIKLDQIVEHVISNYEIDPNLDREGITKIIDQVLDEVHEEYAV